MDYGPMILTSLAYQLPLMAVWVVGLVFAIVRWKRHPRISLLIVIALALAVLGALLSVAGSLMPLILSRNFDILPGRIGMIMGVVNIANIALHLGMWVLVLLAVFSGRASVPGIAAK